MQSRAGGAPLADCEVFSIGDAKSAKSLGRTDAAGRLRIEPTHGRALSLIVASRFLPLARVPLLPGLEAAVTVPVAADRRLRGAEDWLTDWQTEFLDLYIRRRALMAAAGIHLERGEIPAVRHAARTSRSRRFAEPAHRVVGDTSSRVDRRRSGRREVARPTLHGDFAHGARSRRHHDATRPTETH